MPTFQKTKSIAAQPREQKPVFDWGKQALAVCLLWIECKARDSLTPFTIRAYQCADEAGDDHDPVEEDGPYDGRPWHAGCEEKIHE